MLSIPLLAELELGWRQGACSLLLGMNSEPHTDYQLMASPCYLIAVTLSFIIGWEIMTTLLDYVEVLNITVAFCWTNILRTHL